MPYEIQALLGQLLRRGNFTQWLAQIILFFAKEYIIILS